MFERSGSREMLLIKRKAFLPYFKKEPLAKFKQKLLHFVNSKHE